MGKVIKLFKTKQERANISYQASVDAFIPEAMEYADSLMLREHGPRPGTPARNVVSRDYATRWDRHFHRRIDALCMANGIRTQVYQGE